MIDLTGWLAAGQFYLAMTALAVLALPVAAFLRPAGGPDAWALARCAAMPFVAWLAWSLAAAGVGWAAASLIGGIAVVALLSGIALACAPRVRRALRRPQVYLGAELVYLVLFAIVLTIRSWTADLYGLEKFMNIAFVNSVYHADALPAADPWLAGLTINYYYFGHATVALASLMSGQPPDMGTNLMFAHVFAATGCGAFAAVRLIADRGRVPRPLSNVLAGIGAFVLTLGGNFHAVVYGVLRPVLAAYGLAEPKEYFYAQSSRFIGHQPETLDRTITEFPGYSISVGDLHAHVMNLPVAMALLLLIVGLAMGRRAAWAAIAPGAGAMRRAHGLASAAALAVLLGVSAMANSWDLPIYLLLFGFAAIATAQANGRGLISAALLSGLAGLTLLGLAIAASLTFWHHFTPFSQGVRWTIYGSTGWQMAVLYGNYVLVACVAIVAMPGVGVVLRPRRAVGVLLLTAVVLIAIPEFVYVKDLYGDDNARANTMFKLSYQAYLMLPIAAFAGAAVAMRWASGVLPRLGVALLATLFAVSPIVFPALVHGMGAFDRLVEEHHIDGLRFLRNGDREAALWLEAHRPPTGEIMLEASGDSFTYAARLSAVTGIPTVVGWHAHEWLWRDSMDAWSVRAKDVEAFYQTMDLAARRDFLSRWRIRYVVIGDFERERYPALDAAGLAGLGTPVFQSGGTQIVEIGR